MFVARTVDRNSTISDDSSLGIIHFISGCIIFTDLVFSRLVVSFHGDEPIEFGSSIFPIVFDRPYRVLFIRLFIHGTIR